MYTIAGFGNRIRTRREELKLSRALMAEKMKDYGAGVHYETIKTWEGGGACSIEQIPVLCAVLDCDTEYLFGYSPTPHKETASVMEITGLSERAADALIKNKSATISGKENDKIIAINTLIESTVGMRFLSVLHDYIFGHYEWITLSGDDASFSRTNCDGYSLKVFEKRTFSSEVYNSESFIKMLRDSKMAKLQEILIKLRDEVESEVQDNGKH